MTTRDDYAPPSRCELCDGCGWVEVSDHRRHRPTCKNPDSCVCHAVDPCRCTRGIRARGVRERIAADNDWPTTKPRRDDPDRLFEDAS